MDSRPRKLLSTVMSWAESGAGDTDRLQPAELLCKDWAAGGTPVQKF